MEVFENDVLIIPEKYKQMSLDELEKEEARLYVEIKKSSTQVSKNAKQQTNKIHFCF